MAAANEVLEKVLTKYNAAVAKSGVIRGANTRLTKKGSVPSWQDAQDLAGEAGRLMGGIIADELAAAFASDEPLSEADVLAIIPPALRQNHDFVASYVKRMQQLQNSDAHLPPTAPDMPFDKDRADGIAVSASRAEKLAEHLAEMREEIETNSRIDVDRALEEEAAIHEEMGLFPRIVRTADPNCCEWCSMMAGEQEYRPGMDTEIFRRHKNCRCLISYDPSESRNAQRLVRFGRKMTDTSAKVIEKRIRGAS
jgi:hypothetical protein